MSYRSKDEASGLGCLAVVLSCIIMLVHNFIYGPWIMAQLYNWYVMDFLKTGPANWHVAFGIGIVFAYLIRGVASDSFKSESTGELIGKIFGTIAGLWILYWVGWWCSGLNFFGG